MVSEKRCPDCEMDQGALTRRQFVKVVAATAAATSAVSLTSVSRAGEKKKQPESLVKTLYESLSEEQRKQICFAWDYTEKERGLLRTRVSNNWNITPKELNVGGKFFTADQQEVIRTLFEGLYNPDWKDRVLKQLKDDAGGYGKSQTIAIFGAPGDGKFELVMTGRHLTIRCDGDSADRVAFGGPVFYGHAAQGFNEKKDHPGNVYWHQALKANALYKMLDGRQRKLALVERAPHEDEVAFKGRKGDLTGVPISELSSDQKEHAQEILRLLLEPYRVSDQEEAMQCLKKLGGLDKCHLSFYKADEGGKSIDIGNDEVWDVWRLEGPGFVWHYRGAPHVHVWVNVASSPKVKTNAAG